MGRQVWTSAERNANERGFQVENPAGFSGVAFVAAGLFLTGIPLNTFDWI